MSDEQTRPAIRRALQPPLSFGGLERCLQLTYELNEQFLALLKDLSTSAKPVSLHLIAEQKQILSELRTTDIRKAARLPFLLCDFAFTDESAWSHWTAGKSATSKFSHALGVLPPHSGATFARSVITAAWIICSQDVRHATLILGMPLAISSTVAQLKMGDLDRIVQTDAAQLRPRWEARSSFWRKLLCAAHSGDEQQLQASRIHGLAMLAGEQFRRQNASKQESANDSNTSHQPRRLTEADFSLPPTPVRKSSMRTSPPAS